MIVSLTSENGRMSRKTIEMTLQRKLLHHLGKDYSALVSAIETRWKEDTINLSDTILRIIRHAEINKGSAQDTKKPQSLSPASIELQKERAERLNALRGVTTHFNNRCWIKNSELRAKYSLRQTTPQGSNRSLRKAAATAAERRETSTAPPPPPSLLRQNLTTKGTFGGGPSSELLTSRLGLRRSCMQRSISGDWNKNRWIYV